MISDDLLRVVRDKIQDSLKQLNNNTNFTKELSTFIITNTSTISTMRIISESVVEDIESTYFS